jgi:uncharacterized protein (DUF983 family)
VSGSSGEPSLARAALTCSCPRCGKGRIYAGVLSLRDSCDVCGLDLREVDTGDGGAFAGIMVVSVVVVALAFWVEFRFSPPIWLHVVLWPVVTVPLSVIVMRLAKAGLVAAQYHYRKHEMGL